MADDDVKADMSHSNVDTCRTNTCTLGGDSVTRGSLRCGMTLRSEWQAIARSRGITLTSARRRYYRLKAREAGRVAKSGRPGVYMVLFRSYGAVKVGWGADVSARMRCLQVACPEQLELLCVVEGSRKTERELHARFAADHIRGEWFRYSAALQAYVATAAGLDGW